MTRKTTDSRCEEGSSRTDFVGMLRGVGLLLAGCAAAVLPSILNIPSAIWMLPLMNRLRPR